ncbi:MAG TPA: toprim domain-containing protein, partial [Acidobacteriota bacterium]|nr:toprim domain-containing protein [Acidobacteriota bacterium]
AKVNPDAEIVAAFDNDAGGERFAQQLRQMLTDAGLPNEYDRLTPTRKDWNEDWLALLTAARREQTEAERRPDADLVTTPMPRPTTVTTSPAPPAGPSQRPATANPMPTAPTPPAQPDYEEDYGLDL